MTDHAPLTPADCDLTDFEFMPVMTRRLLKSETWTLGNGDERAAAVALWFESWHQVPAASLPSEERSLKRLADNEKWPRVKAQAMRGWILCSDARYYHPIVATKALEAWVEKLVNSISGAEGNSKRWQLAVPIDTTNDVRRLRLAVDMLLKLDPANKVRKKKGVNAILSRSPPDVGVGSPPDARRPSPPDGPPTSPPDRKGQGQGQGQGSPSPPTPGQTVAPRPPQPPETEQPGVTDSPARNPFDEARGREPPPPPPSPQIVVVMALRNAGIGNTNASDPRLLALVARGATTDHFAEAGRAALKAKARDPFAYALAIVEGQLDEAVAIVGRANGNGNGAGMRSTRPPTKTETQAAFFGALSGRSPPPNGDNDADNQPGAIDVESRIIGGS